MADPIRALWEIYVKEETTYGTPNAPSGSDVLEVFDVTPPKLITEPVYKAGDPRYLQETSRIYPGKKFAEFEFSTYMRLGQTTPTPPRIGRLIKAAGFTESENSGYYLYKPTTSPTSLTIYAQTNDGYEFQLYGARVTKMVMSVPIGELVVVRFTVRGMFQSESGTITSLTPSFEGTSLVKASEFSTNTMLMDYWKNLEINLENTIYERIDPTDSAVLGGLYIVKQKITASADYELDTSRLTNIDVGDNVQLDLSQANKFALHMEGYVENREIAENDGVLSVSVDYLLAGGSALKITIYEE